MPREMGKSAYSRISCTIRVSQDPVNPGSGLNWCKALILWRIKYFPVASNSRRTDRSATHIDTQRARDGRLPDPCGSVSASRLRRAVFDLTAAWVSARASVSASLGAFCIPTHKRSLPCSCCHWHDCYTSRGCRREPCRSNGRRSCNTASRAAVDWEARPWSWAGPFWPSPCRALRHWPGREPDRTPAAAGV